MKFRRMVARWPGFFRRLHIPRPLAWILLVAGAFLAVGSAVAFARVVDTWGWPSTQGIVTLSELQKRPGRADREGRVEYEYQVDGIRCETGGVRIGIVGTSSDAGDALRYSTGDRVTVHFDPDDPCFSVLEKTYLPLRWIFFFLVGALIGVPAGVALLRRSPP
jgi:hypothetical protein